MMSMIRLSWLISLAISFFGFLIVGQLYTVKPKDATGNLGFIGMIFFFPFLILSVITTFRYFTYLARFKHETSLKIIGIIAGILLSVFFLYFTINAKNGVVTDVDGAVSHGYFNFYTFGLIHTISGVFGALFGMFKPGKIEEKNNFPTE